MATYSIPEHIFEKHLKEIDNSSFPELFGDLHSKENYASSCFSSSVPQSSRTSFSSCSSVLTNDIVYPIDIPNRNHEMSSMHHRNNSGATNYHDFQNGHLSSLNSENSSTCTEDYGMDGAMNELCNDRNWDNQEPGKSFPPYIPRENCCNKTREGFPPPISSIGTSGQPWVYFKSYKANGRFVLKEIRVQTQEFMHARRENGRLKLTFVHSESEDECFDDDEEDDVSI